MNNHISQESILNPTCWLSLATIPVIVTLSIVESVSKSLIDMGAASEEIFRGSRLPVIHFPEQN
jgi:hypothetical protein